MKRVPMKKCMAVFLSLTCVCLILTSAGCGNGAGGKAKEIPGETKTWGVLSVFVPDGFTFAGGSSIDETDENALRLWKTDDETFYFIFTLTDPADGEQHVESNRSFNQNRYEIRDVTDLTTGNSTWNGICFSDEDGTWTSYAVYAKLDNTTAIQGTLCVVQEQNDIRDAVLASVRYCAD